MMRIELTPQHRPRHLTLARNGETLTIAGEAFDFSGVPDGGILPASAIDSRFIAPGGVTREEGELVVRLLLPVGRGGLSAPKPEPIVDPPDGKIALPGQNGGEPE